MSPRLPDTFIGSETTLKKRKSIKYYQPKIDHLIESSDGSNNLIPYDKVYLDLRDKLPDFHTNLDDLDDDMTNGQFIERMSKKGFKHYQGHLTEHYDKTSSTGRNIGRYIKLKFLFKFLDGKIQGIQLCDSNEVSTSLDQPLKPHLLKRVNGII